MFQYPFSFLPPEGRGSRLSVLVVHWIRRESDRLVPSESTAEWCHRLLGNSGAERAARYLGGNSEDTMLAVLPFSVGDGFSQLSMAFHSGLQVVLRNYLPPRDVLKPVVNERVTGDSGLAS